MQKMLNELMTEQPNERTTDIDLLETEQILSQINLEDQRVPMVVKDCLPEITQAVNMIVAAFENQGRLFYVGAGSSGRIALQDALECPPTYGTEPTLVQGIIAGGVDAHINPNEEAEDDYELGSGDMDRFGVTADDVVVGISASGRTPYVLGAMERASQIGAKVIGLCNNHNTRMSMIADIVIEAVTGAEVVMGSTRMKSGTAQKLILNMLSTTAMIRRGKVYKNYMVDLQPVNEKLVYRAKHIISLATGATQQVVDQIYTECEGNVKAAIIMILTQADHVEAYEALIQSKGNVRDALAMMNFTHDRRNINKEK